MLGYKSFPAASQSLGLRWVSRGALIFTLLFSIAALIELLRHIVHFLKVTRGALDVVEDFVELLAIAFLLPLDVTVDTQNDDHFHVQSDFMLAPVTHEFRVVSERYHPTFWSTSAESHFRLTDSRDS